MMLGLVVGEAGAEGPYARGKAPSVEPAWVMAEGHHPSWVAKSGPKPNRPRERTRGEHP